MKFEVFLLQDRKPVLQRFEICILEGDLNALIFRNDTWLDLLSKLVGEP